MEEKQDSHTVAPQSSSQGNFTLVQDKNNTSISSTSSAMDDLQQVKSYKYLNKFKHTHLAHLNHEFSDFLRLLFQACCSGNGGQCGDHSSSSSVLEILLQEDSHFGMGSAISASTGSASNGCNTSNSGTGHCKLMLYININTLIQKIILNTCSLS